MSSSILELEFINRQRIEIDGLLKVSDLNAIAKDLFSDLQTSRFIFTLNDCRLDSIYDKKLASVLKGIGVYKVKVYPRNGDCIYHSIFKGESQFDLLCIDNDSNENKISTNISRNLPSNDASHKDSNNLESAQVSSRLPKGCKSNMPRLNTQPRKANPPVSKSKQSNSQASLKYGSIISQNQQLKSDMEKLTQENKELRKRMNGILCNGKFNECERNNEIESIDFREDFILSAQGFSETPEEQFIKENRKSSLEQQDIRMNRPIHRERASKPIDAKFKLDLIYLETEPQTERRVDTETFRTRIPTSSHMTKSARAIKPSSVGSNSNQFKIDKIKGEILMKMTERPILIISDINSFIISSPTGQPKEIAVRKLEAANSDLNLQIHDLRRTIRSLAERNKTIRKLNSKVSGDYEISEFHLHFLPDKQVYRELHSENLRLCRSLSDRDSLLKQLRDSNAKLTEDFEAVCNELNAVKKAQQRGVECLVVESFELSHRAPWRLRVLDLGKCEFTIVGSKVHYCKESEYWQLMIKMQSDNKKLWESFNSLQREYDHYVNEQESKLLFENKAEILNCKEIESSSYQFVKESRQAMTKRFHFKSCEKSQLISNSASVLQLLNSKKASKQRSRTPNTIRLKPKKQEPLSIRANRCSNQQWKESLMQKYNTDISKPKQDSNAISIVKQVNPCIAIPETAIYKKNLIQPKPYISTKEKKRGIEIREETQGLKFPVLISKYITNKKLLHYGNSDSIAIYKVYDKSKILKFDPLLMKFDLLSILDKGEFNEVYNPVGSMSVCTPKYLITISGKDFNQFFLYNIKLSTMVRLEVLSFNHSFGGLVYRNKSNTLYCLSGLYNKSVESYCLSAFEYGTSKRIWKQDSQMTIERSQSSYMLVDQDTLYAFFGFCLPKDQDLDTIEYTNLEILSQWATIQVKNESKASLKGHACFGRKGEILLLGGFDGLNNRVNDGILSYDLVSRKVYDNEDWKPNSSCFKYSSAVSYFCNLPSFVTFRDEMNNVFNLGFDDEDRIHFFSQTNSTYEVLEYT